MRDYQLLLGLTGWTNKHWQSKIREINQFKISQIALFLEKFTKGQRLEIYDALIKSNVETIPLVHARNDLTKAEMLLLIKRYKTKYFTIHEEHFNNLDAWHGLYKSLYLEMNYDNFIAKNVKIEKIGGFCLDFAHFKVGEEKWTKEFEYTMKRKKIKKYFPCNHLSGYSPKKNVDLHYVKSKDDFAYLKTLPKFIFGKIIAIEIDNSLREQIKYQKYLINCLKIKIG